MSALSPLSTDRALAADLTAYGAGGGGGGDNGGGGAGAVIYYDGGTYVGGAGQPGGDGSAGAGGSGYSGLPFTVLGGQGGEGSFSFGGDPGQELSIHVTSPQTLGNITLRGGQGGYEVSSPTQGQGGGSDPSHVGGAGGTPGGTSPAGQGGGVYFDASSYVLRVTGNIDVISGATGVSSAAPAGNVGFSAATLEAVGSAAQNFTFHTVAPTEPGVAASPPQSSVNIGTLVLRNDVDVNFLGLMADDVIWMSGLEFEAGKTLTVVTSFNTVNPGTTDNLSLGGPILVNGPGAVLDMRGSSVEWNANGSRLTFTDLHPGLVGQTMLRYEGAGSGLLLGGSSVHLYMRSADENFMPGDTITLVSGALDPGNGLFNNQTTAFAGAVYYLFDLELSAAELNAVFLQRGILQDDARSYGHGLAASTMFVRSRGDAIVDALTTRLPRHEGAFSFSSFSGGHLRGGDGRNVTLNSAFAAWGLGYGMEAPGLYTAVGAFFDYGFGKWKAGTPEAMVLRHGRGDLESWGGGLVGRMDFDRHAVRLDASLAYGRVNSDLWVASNQLAHAATYDYSADVINAHLSARKLFAIDDNHGIELNAAMLYAWQGSDSFTTTFDERLKADSVDSLRTRLGTRYVFDAPKPDPEMAGGKEHGDLSLFIGAAWEKEYEAKNRMSLNGESIDYRNGLRGDSALGEIGLKWTGRTLELELTASARGGDTRGYGGMANLSWKF